MKQTTAIHIALTLAACIGLGFNARAAVLLTASDWDSDVDLTAEGTEDWVVWDTTNEPTDTNGAISGTLADIRVEKFGGTAIGALNKVGIFDPEAMNISHEQDWINGEQVVSGTSGKGVRVDAVAAQFSGGTEDKGFTFDVAAGPVGQTLRLYTKIFKAEGTLTATLKDSLNNTLGTPVSLSQSSATGPTEILWEVFFSDPAAKTLTVDWINTDDLGSADNIGISAVTLTVIPEPASLTLLLAGVAAIFTLRRRRS